MNTGSLLKIESSNFWGMTGWCTSSAGDEVAVFSRWHKNKIKQTHAQLVFSIRDGLSEMALMMFMFIKLNETEWSGDHWLDWRHLMGALDALLRKFRTKHNENVIDYNYYLNLSNVLLF
jgi:hypothetical protein